MNTALDSQLGDMIWSITTSLRAGYDLRQGFKVLSVEAPEPAASACKRLLVEMEQFSYETALANWQASSTSPGLARLADLLLRHSREGGFLPDLLDVLGEELLQQSGSDPAFYSFMRQEAEQLGAPLPTRAAA